MGQGTLTLEREAMAKALAALLAALVLGSGATWRQYYLILAVPGLVLGARGFVDRAADVVPIAKRRNSLPDVTIWRRVCSIFTDCPPLAQYSWSRC